MNRFKIILGSENDFEQIWRTRETYLDEVTGFKEFHLLKGESNEEYTLYSSHSVWDSKEDFIAWTKSESFRKAHKDAGKNKPLYIGHPSHIGLVSSSYCLIDFSWLGLGPRAIRKLLFLSSAFTVREAVEEKLFYLPSFWQKNVKISYKVHFKSKKTIVTH